MTKIVSLSLPDDVAANLKSLANVLGISRSAFMSELVRESLEEMCNAVNKLPPPPYTEESFQRFKGESKRDIEKKVHDLQEAVRELFDEDI